MKNFFSFRRKKEKEPDELTLSIDQVSTWLTKIESEEFTKLISEADNLVEKIVNDIDSLKAKGQELADVKVEENEFIKPFLHTIITSKNMLSKKLLNITSNLDLPELNDFSEVVKFHDEIHQLMKHLEESIITHGRVVSSHLKSEWRILVISIKQLRDDSEKLKEFIKLNSDKDTVLKDAILNSKRLDESRRELTNCQSKINNIENSIINSNSTLKDLKAEHENLQSRDEYKKNQDVILEIKHIEKDIKTLENRIINLFSRLVRPFHKYVYTVGLRGDTRNLLDEYFKKPLEALKLDKNISIRDALAKLGGGIHVGRIKLKDSDKVIQRIDELIGLLPELQKSALDLGSKLNKVQNSLNTSLLDLQTKIEESFVQEEESVKKGNEEITVLLGIATEKRKNIQELISEIQRTVRVNLEKQIIIHDKI